MTNNKPIINRPLPDDCKCAHCDERFYSRCLAADGYAAWREKVLNHFGIICKHCAEEEVNAPCDTCAIADLIKEAKPEPYEEEKG